MGKDRIKKFKSIAKKSNISSRVHFFGHKSGSELVNYYRSADIFVLPSIYDNFPNVILEAMAMHLPVVATKSGGSEDQVQHGYNGYLTKNNDINDLQHYLQKLMDNPKKDKFLAWQATSMFIKIIVGKKL